MSSKLSDRKWMATERVLEWSCAECHHPIKEHDGYLCVDVAEAVRRINSQAQSMKSSWRARDLTTVLIPRVPWQALHRACDPDPDRTYYWFGVERIRTVVGLLDWNGHLHGKNWIVKTDWDQFIEVNATR